MRRCQNAGYYEVEDPDDLVFTFGEIANSVVSPDDIYQYQVRNLYIEQHTEYFKGDFAREITRILEDSMSNVVRRDENEQLRALTLTLEVIPAHVWVPPHPAGRHFCMRISKKMFCFGTMVDRGN